jgi:hypothetical protein
VSLSPQQPSVFSGAGYTLSLCVSLPRLSNPLFPLCVAGEIPSRCVYLSPQQPLFTLWCRGIPSRCVSLSLASATRISVLQGYTLSLCVSLPRLSNPYLCVAGVYPLSVCDTLSPLCGAGVYPLAVCLSLLSNPYLCVAGVYPLAVCVSLSPQQPSLLSVWCRGMLRAGVSGWMADFGEALPLDACMHDGTTGATWHNKYPAAWAALNREVIVEAEKSPDGTREATERERESGRAV